MIWRSLVGKPVYSDIGKTVRIVRYVQIASGAVYVGGSHRPMVGGGRDRTRTGRRGGGRMGNGKG